MAINIDLPLVKQQRLLLILFDCVSATSDIAK
jgi:hypothetical protein